MLLTIQFVLELLRKSLKKILRDICFLENRFFVFRQDWFVDTKYSLFEGLTGNGCEDSLIIWPSITWVRTCGLTTHFGVGTSPASPSVEAVVFVWVLGVVETFDEFVLLGALSNEGGLLMLGGPRLGMGGLTSLVRVGGPNELSEFAWMGVGGTDVVGMDVEAAGI